MSKKNQNSILFLTTLGVYIGLLMAGSAPGGVIAQQAGAMTRNFDVKDEIEVKDDFDNKPDEHQCDEAVFDEFALAYSLFIVRDYVNGLRIQQEFSERSSGLGEGARRIHHLTYFPTFDPDLERILKIGSEVSLRNWSFTNAQESDQELLKTMEIRHSPTSAELANFQSAFSCIPSNGRPKWSAAAEFVRSHSFVTLQNNHLAVVTRLPRAGLDALLAKDAK